VQINNLLCASPLCASEARILLAHVLGWPRTALITRNNEPLTPAQLVRFCALEKCRLNGQPIAQLTGSREFFGLDFQINSHVLIPRPETEHLVEQALTVLENTGTDRPRVLDLGTGSGAIAIAIAHHAPNAIVTATDDCRQALAVAMLNARHLLPDKRAGGDLRILHGSWFEALPFREQFHLIVSNPPYIAAHDPHLTRGDLRFEPRMALTDHADGTNALHIIIRQAPAWLERGGALWLEHGYNQAHIVQAWLTETGFQAVQSICDLAGIARVSGGIWP